MWQPPEWQQIATVQHVATTSVVTNVAVQHATTTSVATNVAVYHGATTSVARK